MLKPYLHSALIELLKSVISNIMGADRYVRGANSRDFNNFSPADKLIILRGGVNGKFHVRLENPPIRFEISPIIFSSVSHSQGLPKSMP